MLSILLEFFAMQQAGITPSVKHLVLIGGGHSHLAVLKYFGMNPVPGLQITLISRDIETPYSGCLPGYFTQEYSHDDIHIDLRPLAQFAGAQLIQEEISRLDLTSRKLTFDNRPAMYFDILSLNIGSRPNLELVPGAAQNVFPIKPIDQFIPNWDAVLAHAVDNARRGQAYKIAIIGGGPASVELALATEARLRKDLSTPSAEAIPTTLQLISADLEILASHNAKAREFVRSEFERRGIEVLLNHKVIDIEAGQLHFQLAKAQSADAIAFATGASIPQWPFDCGLQLADDGFIAVNSFLQSISHPFVFAAGDAASIKGFKRPKSGVFAVRQGRPLAENLKRYATGKKLKKHIPQKQALALLSMGNGKALASRGNLFFSGRSVWSLKRRIDKKFIRKYSRFPEMPTELNLARGLLDKEEERALRAHAMRCAGCGAKVASSTLNQVLAQLPASEEADIIASLGSVEDAAQIRLDANRVLLQSVDQIKAPLNDPWLFARIASNHSLSDIYAMGAEPHSALATVGIPFASKRLTRATLEQLMLGCSQTLSENDCSLIGGHSAESAELSFGLTVNGFAHPDELLSKVGMQPGDVLVLSKPLGTGTLLAADMRSKARHRWMESAIASMLLANRDAARLFKKYDATACTDVTGFGLAGHLLEMLETHNCRVELDLASIPALAGALECLERGIFSSLHQDNRMHIAALRNHEGISESSRLELLFDPQTSGGLLASLPEHLAADCLNDLHQAGLESASIIGRCTGVRGSEPSISLI